MGAGAERGILDELFRKSGIGQLMAAPPLTGYNNNVRHRGRIFHIQTEDSGVSSPRIWTHLFADGGRIVKSTRTDYSEHVGRLDQVELVRNLMKEQHKAMFVALRSGQLDDMIGFDEDSLPPSLPTSGVTRVAEEFSPETDRAPVRMEVQASVLPPSSGLTSPSSMEALGSPKDEAAPGSVRPSERPYAASRPANIFSASVPGVSLFGDVPLDEKSLDDTILSYLAEAPEAPDAPKE
jgi:hypothetical protein